MCHINYAETDFKRNNIKIRYLFWLEFILNYNVSHGTNKWNFHYKNSITTTEPIIYGRERLTLVEKCRGTVISRTNFFDILI